MTTATSCVFLLFCLPWLTEQLIHLGYHLGVFWLVIFPLSLSLSPLEGGGGEGVARTVIFFSFW